MHSALLADGKVVTAKDYDEKMHGVRIVCMDKCCNVPVYFIPSSKGVISHFKTSGKGSSVHKEECGFSRKLTFQETVAKVSEYQTSLREHGIREIVVKLNLNSIDPDIDVKTNERKQREKIEKEPADLDEDALKEDKPTPQSIGSLRSVKKLFTSVEPDLLATIIVSVKGERIPISELIRHHDIAHVAVWEDKTLNVPYFIHGCIEKVIRRKKVWYINFTATENGFFSLIIFDRHFKHFTLKDNELIGKEVLAYGMLKRNEFNKEKKSTEMIIKTNRYIEFL
ncbi:hypothetical protein V6B14_22380 (plasmid) [Sporosarcina psychrophila]|uniref:hypothetical protein n=1 Tax=Sporosarcina psychrophila TaxID=1476 RepID=UPI0030CCE4A9